MKLRQFLRNKLQGSIEKNQDELFLKSDEVKTTKPAIPAATGSFSENLEQDILAFKQLENPNKEDFSIDENTPFFERISISPSDLNFSGNNISGHSFAAGIPTNEPVPGYTPEAQASAANFNPSANTNSKANYISSPILNESRQTVFGQQQIGRRGNKSYSFTPKKSKANLEAEKKAKKKKQAGSFSLKIEKKAQILRQLSILLEAGMDLRSSLSILEEQEVHNKNIWFFLHDLFVKIEAGESFSESLMSSPVKFAESEIAMIKAGEAIGQQGETLAKMASLIEKKVLVKKKITSAMFYPATVLIVSSVVILLLTTFVVPKFEKVIVDQVGKDGMPALTDFIIKNSRFISSHLLEIVLSIGFAFTLLIASKRVNAIRKWVYYFFLKVPLIGSCVTIWSVVLFSRTFGDLLLCGSSVVESLKMAKESIGNYFMKSNLSLTIDDVQQGLSLTESLRRRNVFPAMAEGLIKVGEESGKLGEMMNKVASSYEEQLDEIITRITALVEPVLVIFLAFFVGSVVIGLFLPLVSLIQNISA